MTDLRTAAQQALEALEGGADSWQLVGPAIDALRVALAEPVQEPVAWRYKKEGGGWFVSDNEPQYVEQWNDIEEIQPLYTAPPQRKPLTEEELERLWYPSAVIAEPGKRRVAFGRAVERAHGIGGEG